MVKTHKSGRYGEATKADIYIPKFNRHYERTLDSNHKFTFGQACVVEYHKGALGLYYIDDVQEVTLVKNINLSNIFPKYCINIRKKCIFAARTLF